MKIIDNEFHFRVELDPDSEETADLVVHATDEGIVFDVYDNDDECIRTGYLFVGDIVDNYTH